jgi:cytochrome d ubiquinol oxidase subunit I
VTGTSVATSLALFVFVYGIIFSMGIYYINRLIAKGPAVAVSEPAHPSASRPLAEGGAAMRNPQHR